MKVYLVETSTSGFYEHSLLVGLHSDKDAAIARARELIGHRDTSITEYALPITNTWVAEMEIDGGGHRISVFFASEDEEELA